MSNDDAAGEEVPSFEIGDRVYIEGGQLDKTRGRIYYMDGELIRILPDGVSDRVIDIPLVEGDLSEDLGVKSFYLLSKAASPSFVAQIDAQVGQIAETFSATGEPGTKYRVVEIREAEDAMILEDETGGRKELQFISEFHRGIGRDEPFAVIRTRYEAGPEEEGAAAAAEGMNNQATEGNEEEIVNVGDFDLLGTEEEEEDGATGLELLSEEERTYPDSVQRNEMIRDLLELLDPNIRKMPKRQKEIRQLSEQMILLRNQIVKYNSNGDPDGMRPTSVQTLGELLTKSDIPIARPVLDVRKSLFLMIDTRTGPVEPINEPTLQVNQIDKMIESEQKYLETNLTTAAADAYVAGALPAWYITWQGIFQKYMHTFVTGDTSLGAPVTFGANKEFFRAPLPVNEDVRARGLAANPEAKQFTNPLSITQVRAGVMKGLGPRETRLKSGPIRVESGEEGILVNQMIFPLSTERELGSIRSGSIAKDIAVSHQEFRTIHTLLKELNYIPDEPSAGGIIAVGTNGNTNGNIGIEDWLKGQPFLLRGLGDARVQSSSLGMTQYELNSDQQTVLIDKINSFRASIKHFIKENIDKSNREIQGQRLETQSFLQEEFRAELLAALRAEPLLADKIEDIAHRTPAYKDSDIAIIAAISAEMADYMLAAFSGNPDAIARERTRAVADTFIRTLRNAMKKKQNADMEGQAPTPNTCPHVKELEMIRKTENEQERMGLLSRLLTHFKKGREENWVMCNACNRQLICYHEELQLLAFRHPHDRERINKELMLGFSRGQSGGHYLCKNCGQTMAEIDYDRGMEFNEDGIPLAAAAAPLQQEGEEMTAAEKAFNEVIGIDEGVIKEPGAEEGDPAAELRLDHKMRHYYNTAARIYNMLGIYPEPSALKAVLQRVASEIQRQPSQEQYASMVKMAIAKQGAAQAKKFYDYPVRMNQILIGITAAHIIVEIQCHIPDYVPKYTIPGCVAGFTGYPLGQPEDKTFLNYMICAISGIQDDREPWSQSGLQAMAEATRRDAIEKVIMQAMGDALKLSAVQLLLKDKRAYYEKKYGSLEGAGAVLEAVPAGFRPQPYAATPEEAATAIVVPAAAGEREKAQAWIQEGHKLARVNGVYIKGSPYSETTCCKTSVSDPRGFWIGKEGALPQLHAKESPLGQHDSQLMFHYSARPIQHIIAETPADLMYRVYLQVCYDGPRKGLPHEPGYTNICPHCGFKFPDSPFTPSPAPPLSSDSGRGKEMMKEWKAELDAIINRGKSALESQQVRVSDPAVFQELLDATHKAYRITQTPVQQPIVGARLLEKLAQIRPLPFQGWPMVIANTIERVSSLTPQADVIAIEEAYGPLSGVYADCIVSIRTRLGRNGSAYTELLDGILERSPPTQIAETLRTYFLFPLKRIYESYKRGMVGSALATGIIPTSLKLPKEVEEDVKSEIYRRVVVPIFEISRMIDMNSYSRIKFEATYKQLAAVIPIIQREIRANVVPGGETGMRFLVKTIVAGILAELINPNVISPELMYGMALQGGVVGADSRIPLSVLEFCFQRLKAEGLNYTQEQIKEMLAKRAEAEKLTVFRRWEAMTPEEKAVNKRNQTLGLKEYAVGGTKAIYRLDAEQYERERLERAGMGMAAQFTFTPDEIRTIRQIQAYGMQEGGEGGYDNADRGAFNDD